MIFTEVCYWFNLEVGGFIADLVSKRLGLKKLIAAEFFIGVVLLE